MSSNSLFWIPFLGKVRYQPFIPDQQIHFKSGIFLGNDIICVCQKMAFISTWIFLRPIEMLLISTISEFLWIFKIISVPNELNNELSIGHD